MTMKPHAKDFAKLSNKSLDCKRREIFYSFNITKKADALYSINSHFQNIGLEDKSRYSVFNKSNIDDSIGADDSKL